MALPSRGGGPGPSADSYDVVKQLGSGAFGSVSKVVRRDDKKSFAMKKVQIGRMEEREVADALNECRILASVRHPRIVNFEAAFLARNGRELCLVMELCERGDLAGRIKKCQRMRRRIDERTIWANMVEMAEGLVHLHSKNISHRDLKPANVFLASDGTAKLGDLNVSKLTKGDDLMQTKIGTPYYMAPEVWAGRKYNAACDVWSLGCVVYELAKLEPPFQGNSLMQLRRAVQTGRYPPLPSSYSPQLARIVAQMLVVDPNRRLSALDIVQHDEVIQRREKQILSHPAPAADEENDTELLATIKPPRSRYEVKQLGEQLSAMSAQVATARSESKADLHGQRGSSSGDKKKMQPLASMPEGEEADDSGPSGKKDMGGLGLGGGALDGMRGFQLPGSRFQQQAVGDHINRAHAPAVKPQMEPQPSRADVRHDAGADSESPLPAGWKKVPSQSRPGQFSYLNVNTGERVAERPSRPASAGGPLPPGWKKVPSQSRPGEWVYMNVHTGERIAWRPTNQDGSRPGQAAPKVALGGYGKPAYRPGGYR